MVNIEVYLHRKYSWIPRRNLARILLLAALLIPLACTRLPEASGLPTAQPTLPFAGELQEALERALRTGQGRHALGLSAAVIVPGHQPWTGTTGVSQPGEPITTEMVFNVGSIAKTFEAALALRLAEQGRLDLDEPISRWLPSYRNVSGGITVRQLLNHTSGVFNAFDHPDLPWVGDVDDPGRRWTIEEVFDTYVLAPYGSPGEAQRYATPNYLLLTAILEQEGGAPVPEQIEYAFLRPLGLKGSLITTGAPVPAGYPAAHPWVDLDQDGDLEDISAIRMDWWASLTHPIVYATPADLALWISRLYHAKMVLAPESLAQMLTFPQVADPDPHGIKYGLGVIDYSSALGVRAYGHGGSAPGYEAAALYLPDLGVALAWAFNTGESPGGPADAIMMGTWEALSQVLLTNRPSLQPAGIQ